MTGWIRRAEHLLATGRASSVMETPAISTAEPSSGRVPGEQIAAASAEPARCAFCREGDAWTITYGPTTIRLKHNRGLAFVAALLREPGREIAATELVRGGERGGEEPNVVPARVGLGDAGEMLDPQARATYKQRLAELREELEEAERFTDAGRSERLREEIDFLTAELSRAVGLGGRERRAGSHAERARVNVTRAISAVMKKIAAEHPSLGEHFARTIRTGTFCSYAPDPRAPIEWEV
jgi:non-specific serine/threonine protein kinase